METDIDDLANEMDTAMEYQNEISVHKTRI